jgi:hypothetical protein
VAWSEHGQGHDTYVIALSLIAGGDFESGRGALITCMSLGDPEWSPRAAMTLGEKMRERGDFEAAERYLRFAADSGHPDWSVCARVALGVI